jgi:hypothetical protein
MSVFTHLTEAWSGWLLELHRVLKPDGWLIATFLGPGMVEELLGESWDADRTGMNVIGAGRPWSDGGPLVFHSEWWLRAHWGRAFDVIELYDGANSPGAHGLAVLRKKPAELTVSALEEPEPEEPRELAAARHNIAQLHAEDRRTRALFARRWTSRARARLRRINLRHPGLR